jgi:hypothetical protein
MKLRFFILFVTGVVLLAYTRLTFAYCLMTTCDVDLPPETCSNARDENGCSIEGMRVRWPTSCLSFSVHRDGSKHLGITSAQFESIVSQAFAAWQSVVCSDGNSSRLSVETYPRVQCEDVGFEHSGPNQNLWIFRDDATFAEVADKNTIALTSLTIDEKTGAILDADVELNAYGNTFSTSSDKVQTDLMSIVLHESGHVLGLGHSDWATSVMASGYDEGSITSRTLQLDDRDALCALMETYAFSNECDAEPLGGFSTECDEYTSGCCSLAPGRTPRSTATLVVVLLMVLGKIRRLTRRCSRPNPKGELSLPQTRYKLDCSEY